MLIVDPARRFNCKSDREFADRLAQAFFCAGYEIIWAIDWDDRLPDRPYAQIRRILESPRVDGAAEVATPDDDPPLPFSERADRSGGDATCTCARSSQDCGGARSELNPADAWDEMPAREGDVSTLIAELGPRDAMVLPAANLNQLESLFALLPRLGLSQPLQSTLQVRFASAERLTIKPSADAHTLGRRLKSGSPIRALVFHADTANSVAAMQKVLNIPVHHFDGDLDPARLRRRFCPVSFPESPSSDALPDVAPSLIVEHHGPIALLVSALWGRVGSTMIFDAQARYLIERGFVVARIYVDEWPRTGLEGSRRIHKRLVENFEQVRPHLYFVAERNEEAGFLSQLETSAEFQHATPLKRLCMLLQGAKIDELPDVAWCAERAAVAVVNHLPHVAFVKRLTRAPIVLETHDIYANLLNSHGIPSYVPIGPDGQARREQEEAEIWRTVDACVNLSADDNEIVGRAAKRSFLARPYVNQRMLKSRSWLEVVEANQLAPSYNSCEQFDIMMWGDWHGGNVAGIRWFLEEVIAAHPRLRDISILLVGRVRDGLPPSLLRRRGLHAVGFVDRIEDFMARSVVLVVPDRPGSTGVSVKAIDVCARGCCFSSTAAGLRGMDMGDTGFVASTDAAGLASDIAELLDSPDARSRRIEVARRLYELNYSKDAHARAWDAVIEAVVPNLPMTAATSLTADDEGAETRPVADGGRKGTRRAERPHGSPPEEGVLPGTQSVEGEVPQLSVVVCTYDRYDVLPAAIDSLLQQRVDAGFLEIIVVDNSPDQSAAARFREQYAQEPRVRYLLEPRPGLSNARNVGVGKARGKYVAFIDDDAIADEDWASQIVAAFEKFAESAGVVGGRVLPRWISPPPSWMSEKLLDFLSIVDWGGQVRPLRPKEWLVGCNIAYDRELLLSVGGFSSALGRVGPGYTLLSNEETEVAERIGNAGRISVYCPDALVHHIIDPARLTRTWFRRRSAWQAVSDYIKDARKTAEYAPAAAEHVREALRSGRHGSDFFRATDDPQQFKRDVGLAYDLVVSVLAGGTEPVPKQAAAPAAPLHSRFTQNLSAKPVVAEYKVFTSRDLQGHAQFVLDDSSELKGSHAKYGPGSYWRNRMIKLRRSIAKRLPRRRGTFWNARMAGLMRGLRKHLR